MIELRWLDRTRYDEEISFDEFIERVLQYRQWRVRIDASGAITPLPEPIEWTDWQDVPTVKE